MHGSPNCNVDFEGTSSAAPLAAGCFALVLEAKYVITYYKLASYLVFKQYVDQFYLLIGCVRFTVLN